MNNTLSNEELLIKHFEIASKKGIAKPDNFHLMTNRVRAGMFLQAYGTDQAEDEFRKAVATQPGIITNRDFNTVLDYLQGKVIFGDELKICPDCKEEHFVEWSEILWFKEKGLTTPARCKDCRSQRKKK